MSPVLYRKGQYWKITFAPPSPIKLSSYATAWNSIIAATLTWTLTSIFCWNLAFSLSQRNISQKCIQPTFFKQIYYQFKSHHYVEISPSKIVTAVFFFQAQNASKIDSWVWRHGYTCLLITTYWYFNFEMISWDTVIFQLRNYKLQWLSVLLARLIWYYQNIAKMLTCFTIIWKKFAHNCISIWVCCRVTDVFWISSKDVV